MRSSSDRRSASSPSFLLLISPRPRVLQTATRSVRHQHVMKPLRLRSFLERHMHSASEVTYETDDGFRLRRHCRTHRHRALLVSNAHHQGCLVDVETHILNRQLFHGSRSFLAPFVRRLHGSRRERAFNMR